MLYPLEARAAAFCLGERTVCVITLDVIGVSRETTGRIRDRLRECLGLVPANVMVCASHTHCVPATVNLLGLPIDECWIATVEDAAVRCATQAVANLRPVRLGVGCAAAHFNINRRPLPGLTQQFSVNWGGVVDKRVRVLRVDGANGRPVAVLFHYSCHPTTKAGSEGLISSDFPGVARAHIEYEMGCPALFLPGCFANIRPLVLNERGDFVSATKDQLDDIGRELGSAACRAAKGVQTVEGTLLDGRELPLVLPFGPGKSVAELESIANETAPSAVAVKWPWAQRVIAMTREGRLPREEVSAMQALRIGPVSLVSIPGEPVQEMGYAIERRAAALGDVWPVGYTNDMLGYLVTKRQKAEGGYEPSAYPFFDRPAPFADEETRIEDVAAKLLGV